MQNISSNYKLKSKYFIQRIENCKKFRINCRKMQLKPRIYMRNTRNNAKCFKMRT